VTGVMVERSKLSSPRPSCGVIVVENTRAAFGRMAGRYRQDFPVPLIAVAGSNGKTTTKELIASVLAQKFTTVASRGSYNNDVGVPTTLFEIGNEHQAAVLEFGTNHPGELAPLLRLAQPSIGVLTSIGREHLEFFGDLDGVIEEEGWLAELLPPQGRLFLNGDTPGAAKIASRACAAVVKVGLSSANDWRATDIRLNDHGLTFLVQTANREFAREFHAPILGRHQVTNILLAIAVAETLTLSPAQIQLGLDKVHPAKMRLQPWKLGEVQVLDDSYNANADSMRAALETLREFPCAGRRVAVLGDMAELGDHAPAAHAEIGGYAGRLGLDRLYAVGQWAGVLASAAQAAGFADVSTQQGIPELVADLRGFLRPGDVLLLKASRAMGLERVGEQLRALAANNDLSQGPNRLGKE
jgi:UDP-N-acetylmuramoyl-tripeptide--D-alanyl-D-alanine ligase